MLDPKEIEIEIARLEYMESSYPNYAKLADLYVIQNQMKQKETPIKEEVTVQNTAIERKPEIGLYGESDFLQTISGKQDEEIWPIMDDLMDTLRVANPKVYSRVMRRIKDT